jgi:hypothetical protein
MDGHHRLKALELFFKKYPDNLIGFRINADVKVIDFWLDPAWSILEDHIPEEIKLKKQKISEDTGLIYYIMFSDLLTFEDMYGIFSKIIEYNLDLQKKQDLFSEKMTELKGLFGKLTYDELKQLSFDTPLSIMDTGIKRSKKVEEPIVEEPKLNTENNETEIVKTEEKNN